MRYEEHFSEPDQHAAAGQQLHLKYTRFVCSINVGSFTNAMSKRLNIILPDKTVAVLDRVTTKGNRSRFIDRAVRHLIETEGKANLRARLKEEAIENADRDLAMAAEWFPLEEEAAQLAESSRARKPGRKRP